MGLRDSESQRQNGTYMYRYTKVELLIDGHTGFLFRNKDGKPKVAIRLEYVRKRIVDRYSDTRTNYGTV